MRGLQPPSGVWIGVAGLDLVRDRDGEWLVLEDNVRTPSGFAYLHATRRALLEHIDVPPDATPRPLDGEIDLLADALRAVAPESARGHRAPLAAVLTDGEHNSAYWEHAWLSRQLGIPLVEPHELELRDGDAVAAPARPARGAPDRRRLPPHERRPAGLRHRPAADRARSARGVLGLVNQYGTGVADDKLTHAYVEQMIRFYVGEEPVLRSVPTYDLAQPDQLEEALDVFDELVLKPRAGHGGVGVLIAPRASARTIEATRAAVIADPGAWIAQRMVMLSTHPTVVDGGALAPRHIDLRPFVFLGEGCTPRVLPGRPDPRRPLRGRARRQLVPERRRQGHLGPALSSAARSRRPLPAAREAAPDEPEPLELAEAGQRRARLVGRLGELGERAAAVLDRVEQALQRRRERDARGAGVREHAARSRPRAGRARRRRRGSAARRPGSARACPPTGGS